MHVRVCPECQCEYMPRAERCSDCGVALVDRLESDGDIAGEPGGGEPRQDDPSGVPPGEYRALVRRDTAVELDPLAARLGQLGIPYGVHVCPWQAFELRVRPEERERAVAGLGELIRPDEILDPPGVGFDAERGSYDRCPACEAALPPRARECEECGLQLSFEVPRCAACDSEVNTDNGLCPRCASEPA